jgi:hypothetical protein
MPAAISMSVTEVGSIEGAGEPRWGDCSVAQAKQALTHDERRFVTAASVAIAFLILTQKLVIGFGIEIGVLAVWPFTIWAFTRGYCVICPLRATGYLFTAVAIAAVSIANSAKPGFSLTSPLFFVALYIPFIFVSSVRRVVYLSIVSNLQLVTLFIGAMVFLQWAQQALGMPMMNMERLIPGQFLFPGYNYLQTIGYASSWYKPNAFFMLETSHTSQLLAIGFVVEMVLFKRPWAMLWLLLALVMTFGGTGTLMVIATLPFLIPYLSRRIIAASVVAAPVALLVAVKLGFLSNALDRAQEFGEAGTSGGGRFVGPFQILRDTMMNVPKASFLGIGAGTVSPYQYSMYDVINPIAKSMLDYGIPTGLAWLIWFHASTFGSRAPFAIIWVVLLQFDFMGGSLLIPVQAYYCFFLCAAIMPARDGARGPGRLFPERDLDHFAMTGSRASAAG